MNLTYEELCKYWTPQEKAEFDRLAAEKAARTLFFPTPGPQLEAYRSEADIIGYGGAAGGGKSMLITGLACSSHLRSSITRPQKNQTKKFVQEIAKMLGSRDGYSSQTSSWTFTDRDGVERYIEFYGLDNPGDEEKQQGVDFDLKCYDEVTQMREEDIRYTLTWNRTDNPNQRVRALLTFNPPTTPEGRWVIKFFAPWLDKGHPNPAKDGELRWFATVGDNKDYELAGPQPFIIKDINGKPTPWYSFHPKDHKPEDIIKPESRTFFRAKVTDNPYYMQTDYVRKLQALPEPLRSQMLKGDFLAGVEDDAHQLIPTKWIDDAMERWKARQPDIRAQGKGPMDAVGVDAARGGNMGSTLGAIGNDELVIAPRYGTYFDELKIYKGVDINDGFKASALVIAELRDQAPVQIDVIGIGTSPYDVLTQNNIQTVALNGAAASGEVDKSGLLRFANKRAEWGWRMREALDPSNPAPIALPPDPQMAADLASIRWTVTKQGILLEPKEKQKERLGRSPDRGEAVIYANISTPKRLMVPGGLANLPSFANSGSYEQNRLRELEQ